MNTLQASQQKKKAPKPVVVDNPIESLKNVGENVVHEVTQASTDAVKDMWAQILGVDRYANKPQAKMSGDLKPGQAVDLKSVAKENKKQEAKAEAPINYFREISEAGKNTAQKETGQIRQEVQMIIMELKRLASSSKVLQQEVAAATGHTVVNPGKYHVNFFEWMLLVIRDARKRVENAGAWLHTVKKKKMGYWGMVKKKGTSFMLSGERAVSNQTA